MKKHITVLLILCIFLTSGLTAFSLTPPPFTVPSMTFDDFNELVRFMTNPNMELFAETFLASAQYQYESGRVCCCFSINDMLADFERNHTWNIERIRERGYLLEIYTNEIPIASYIENIITVHGIRYSFRFDTGDMSGGITISFTDESHIRPFEGCRECGRFGLCTDCEWSLPPSPYKVREIQINEQDYTIAVYEQESIRLIHFDQVGFSIRVWTTEDSELSAIQLAETFSFVLHPLDGTSPRNSICTATRPNPYLRTNTIWIVLAVAVAVSVVVVSVIVIGKKHNSRKETTHDTPSNTL